MQDGNDLKNGVPDSHYTFQRWLPAIQNDWAARADWCVADEYSKANHQLLPGYWEKVYAQSGREKNNTGCLSFI